jgi:hypothetical protein
LQLLFFLGLLTGGASAAMLEKTWPNEDWRQAREVLDQYYLLEEPSEDRKSITLKPFMITYT